MAASARSRNSRYARFPVNYTWVTDGVPLHSELLEELNYVAVEPVLWMGAAVPPLFLVQTIGRRSHIKASPPQSC